MFITRVIGISIVLFIIFIFTVLSFSTKQAIIVDKYYHQRDLSPIFYKLNR